VNKIYEQVDHDFRRLTKLVLPFFDFSMIYYKFYKFIFKTKLTNALERKRASGHQNWPSERAATAWPMTGAPARPVGAPTVDGPQARAANWSGVAQRHRTGPQSTRRAWPIRGANGPGRTRSRSRPRRCRASGPQAGPQGVAQARRAFLHKGPHVSTY